MALGLLACDNQSWNDPYTEKQDPKSTLYRVFNIRPKHLDPALSYEATEAQIVAQIYDAPLHYHYLKRPYTLEPNLLKVMPSVSYYDAAGQPLALDAPTSLIATSVYHFELKPNIYFQPHPGFVTKPSDNIARDPYRQLGDFKTVATRELNAADMVYSVKRLANPNLNSPFYGMMSRYIQGLKEFHDDWLAGKIDSSKLTEYPFSGAKVIDKYRYQIIVKGKYRQFEYWQAMTAFSPIPHEADAFYDASLARHNITLDRYPIGTGPFMLSENNPNRRITLVRNPNYRDVYYPVDGTVEDQQTGILALAGQKLPLVDQMIFTLEKEEIPNWKKFLQGYYDFSGIGSEIFNQAVLPTHQGPLLTDALKEKGIRLQTSFASNWFCWAFNMLDETLGGQTDRARKLREAIAIAFNSEEFIELFMNNRAKIAHSPLPPDVFGYQAQAVNDKVYQKTNTGIERYPLAKAQALLKSAGYENGIDPATNRPLQLYWDSVRTSNPNDHVREAWLIKQFKKLGIQLKIRGTDSNRFQDKIKQGQAQMFISGWRADYPDPENFLFLFQGSQAKAKLGGENFSNYQNPKFDLLFEEMRALPNNDKRQKIIDKMTKILQDDLVLIGGFYPSSDALYHEWLSPIKTGAFIQDTAQYIKVKDPLRQQKRWAWNQPLVWPLGALGLWLLIFLSVLRYLYYKKMSFKVKET